MKFIGLNHSLSSLLCAFQVLVILRLSWRCKPVPVAPDFLFPQASEEERAQVSLPVAVLPDSRAVFRLYHLRPSAYSKTVMASAGYKNASSGTCHCEKGDGVKIISLHRLLCVPSRNGFLDGATCSVLYLGEDEERGIKHHSQVSGLYRIQIVASNLSAG